MVPRKLHDQGLFFPQTPGNSSTTFLQVGEKTLVKIFEYIKYQIF